MPDVSPETTAVAQVFDYAHYQGDAASSDAFRTQVTDLLKAGHDTPGFDEGFTQRLIDSGTLPDLLVKEWAQLDTDGSKKIEYTEILDAAESDDPLRSLLGNVIDRNTIPGLRTGDAYTPLDYATPVTYDSASRFALNTPEQRPIAEGPAVVAPIPPYEIPAGVLLPAEVPPPIPGVALPPAGLSAEATAAWSSLQVPGIAPEAKLKAITTLVAAGQTSVSIKDADGTVLNVRLEVSPISEGSSKNFVHMFAVDPATGKETVMMRALTDGTNFFKQRDANGEEVGFIGSKWMKNHPGSMFKS